MEPEPKPLGLFDGPKFRWGLLGSIAGAALMANDMDDVVKYPPWEYNWTWPFVGAGLGWAVGCWVDRRKKSRAATPPPGTG